VAGNVTPCVEESEKLKNANILAHFYLSWSF